MSTVDAPAPPRTTTVVPAVAPWWRRSAPWVLLAAGTLGGIALQTQLYTAQERVVGTVFMFVALATAWNLIGGNLRLILIVDGPPPDRALITELNHMRALERVIAQMEHPARTGFERLQRPLSFRMLKR